jgi:HEPN domain-containing protein
MVLDRARVLDAYSIATRYANGHEKGAPFAHYGSLQSKQAIEYASVLIEFARTHMAESR